MAKEPSFPHSDICPNTQWRGLLLSLCSSPAGSQSASQMGINLLPVVAVRKLGLCTINFPGTSARISLPKLQPCKKHTKPSKKHFAFVKLYNQGSSSSLRDRPLLLENYHEGLSLPIFFLSLPTQALRQPLVPAQPSQVSHIVSEKNYIHLEGEKRVSWQQLCDYKGRQNRMQHPSFVLIMCSHATKCQSFQKMFWHLWTRLTAQRAIIFACSLGDWWEKRSRHALLC